MFGLLPETRYGASTESHRVVHPLTQENSHATSIRFWASDWLAEQFGDDDEVWGTYEPGTVYVQFVPDDADELGSDDIAYVEISVPPVGISGY
jgi:hypothetical protein